MSSVNCFSVVDKTLTTNAIWKLLFCDFCLIVMFHVLRCEANIQIHNVQFSVERYLGIISNSNNSASFAVKFCSLAEFGIIIKQANAYMYIYLLLLYIFLLRVLNTTNIAIPKAVSQWRLKLFFLFLLDVRHVMLVFSRCKLQ